MARTTKRTPQPPTAKDKAAGKAKVADKSRTGAASADEVDPTGIPAHEKATGHVLKNGKFQCLDTHGGTKTCHSKMQNDKKCIQSHLSKKKAGSRYSYSQLKGQGAKDGRWPCPFPDCTRDYGTFNTLVDHARAKHAWDGKSDLLRKSIAPSNDA
ncbi:hypothetical protein F4780DRAFT_270693 [Xylariomycetidae sp. FL0641]|nr:hypothetical protein F4780DRAFT_270693 [Xylariomycetidae sp. FL0641]